MIPGGHAQAQAKVGVAMLVLLGMGVVTVVAIVPRLPPAGGIRAQIGFAHVGALQEGAPIIVAGRTVGRVESIVLVDTKTLAADHLLAGVGGAMVHIRVDRGLRWMVPANGEFFISSRGILSDRYLEIAPPRNGEAPGAALTENAQIRGVDPPSLDRALQRTWRSLLLQREFLVVVEPEIEALQISLRALSVTLAEVASSSGFDRLVTHLRTVVEQVDLLRHELALADVGPGQLAGLAERSRGGLERAQAAVTKLRVAVDLLMSDLDRIASQLAVRAPQLDHARAAFASVSKVLARAEALVANGQELVAMLERGEGSAMKLGSDPEFAEEAKGVGKVLKRNPWRILGRPDDATTVPKPQH